MIRKIKKVLYLFVTIVFCGTLFPISACATDGLNGTPVVLERSQAQMIEFLLDRGYPNDYLEGLIPQQIQNLYRIAYENDAYYLETTPTIVPYGNIPDDELSLETTLSYNTIVRDGITYIYEIFVSVDYEWFDGHPLVRKADAITVNWDGDILTYNDDFLAQDFAFSLNYNDWITYKTWNEPSTLNQGGLGNYTYIDYKENVTGAMVNAIGLKGSLYFALTPEPRYSMGWAPGENSTTINAEYVHDTNPLYGSLSFTYDGFGVTVNTGVLDDDSQADSARIDYIRYD